MQKYSVFLEEKASRHLEKLSKDARSRITEALHTLRDEGFSIKLDIRKLRGFKNHYRIRIGRHRVLFELQPERMIVVYAILLRKAAY